MVVYGVFSVGQADSAQSNIICDGYGIKLMVMEKVLVLLTFCLGVSLYLLAILVSIIILVVEFLVFFHHVVFQMWASC